MPTTFYTLNWVWSEFRIGAILWGHIYRELFYGSFFIVELEYKELLNRVIDINTDYVFTDPV